MEIVAGDLRGTLARQAGGHDRHRDVLAVLKPIWTAKAETASRVRGRIEKVLDAAKAKGYDGENPARGAAIWITCCPSQSS